MLSTLVIMIDLVIIKQGLSTEAEEHETIV